jgi:hypothetical protein
MMLAPSTPYGTGTWGANVLSWMQPFAPRRVALRYEDLVQDPRTAAAQAMVGLGLDLKPAAGASLPTFAELNQIDPTFFRRGHTGTYRDELPEDLHRVFWSAPANAEAMALLGYALQPG